MADSCVVLAEVIDVPLPEPLVYQGVMRPDAVDKVRSARIEADKQAFRTAPAAHAG